MLEFSSTLKDGSDIPRFSNRLGPLPNAMQEICDYQSHPLYAGKFKDHWDFIPKLVMLTLGVHYEPLNGN